jgi:hypothetical protein
MKALSTLACIVGVAIATSGCIDGDDLTDKYEDADQRVARSVQGGYATEETITVPPGAARLTVKAAWDVEGGAAFELTKPDGSIAKEAAFGGANRDDQATWYAAANPTPGEWELDVAVGGRGSFAFGIYV